MDLFATFGDEEISQKAANKLFSNISVFILYLLGLISALCVQSNFLKNLITIFYNCNSTIFHCKIVITIVLPSDCIILYVIVYTTIIFSQNFKITTQPYYKCFIEITIISQWFM